MTAENWDKTLYKNWVRGAKGLEYLQEGLQDFVGDKVLKCRDLALQNITSKLPAGAYAKCSQCTSENLLPEHSNLSKPCSRNTCLHQNRAHCFGSKPRGRRKCPNGICSKLYDEIVKDHQSNDPLWKNTDPSTWCSDPTAWSFAKCFETTLGPGTSAKETDASGLLSILINSCSIQSWIACPNMDSSTVCPFYKARYIRNAILHSAKLELEDHVLEEYLETFKTVLGDPKCLVYYAGSCDAIDKLKQLKIKQINISQKDEANILKLHQETLELEGKRQEVLQDIETQKGAAVQEIKKQKGEVVQEIEEGLSVVKKAKIELVAEKKNALSEIEVARSAAVEEVSNRQSVVAGPSDEEPLLFVGSTATSGPHCRNIATLLTYSESVYNGRKTQLKEDLIVLYRNLFTDVPLSPLFEEEDTPLLDFCVMPDIYTVELQRALGGGKEIRTRAGSLLDVFNKKDKKCHNIYLTADAGLGKTVFSKRLALTWCQAHDPVTDDDKHFSKEEIQAMTQFEYMFLVFLRDSDGVCEIDDLVMTQICKRLARSTITLEDLENIMSKENCLVILDGLDEWAHPSHLCRFGSSEVPHRKARQWTILTTTRPWKLGAICLKASAIDRRVEIVGLKKEQANALKLKVISQLCGAKEEEKLKSLVHDFTKTIKDKGISDLETIPLILMYLLCLWCEKIDLGRCQCDLYSSIIELLLSRTIKKYNELQVEAEQVIGGTPQCFRKHEHCKKHYKQLTDLGRLAFETLFDESRENTLVFDRSEAEKYLNKENLNFFFFSGIITQNKVRRLTTNVSKVSFAHKTVHEFLAALYMQSTNNKTSMRKKIFSRFKSIKDILEMSKVLIFLSGIDTGIPPLVSNELVKIIDEDEISCTYRGMPSSYYYDKYVQPLKDVQEMCVMCMKENQQKGDLILPLQDIFINKQCQQESYRLDLQCVTKKNSNNIKSVCMEMEGIPFNVQQIFQIFAIADLNNIVKFYYRGEVNECDIKPLLNEEVKCLSIISSKWQENHFTDAAGSWSPILSSSLCSLKKLEALYINGFKMRHELLKKLGDYITGQKSMREVMLIDLDCTDDGASCPGSSLDLSEHSNLRTLALAKVPLTTLEINVSSLEDCEIGHLSKHGLVSHSLNTLRAARKLITFTASYLETSEDITTMLATLRLLVHVKDVWLWDIDLGERPLTLSSEMVNIECLRLRGVKMTCTSLRDLIDVVKNLPQSVTVYMRDCMVKPEDEFEKVKLYIQTSEHFVVTYDSAYKNGKVTEFKTIKD